MSQRPGPNVPAAPQSASPAAAPDWVTLGAVDEYPPAGLRQARARDLHLVVARTEDGGVFVLDNRCPHEGYPLAQGTLRDCALTCCWHNWKFDVRDGACTLGEEGVRSFPCRVRAGVLEVDVAEPDPSAVIPALCASLQAGLAKHEMGRLSRDGIRLIQAGYDPWRLLADVARYDALHGEYGPTHALPVAADVGRLLERYAGPDALYAIAPAMDMCGDANRRLPVRARPEPLEGATRASLRAAVEAEDAERAEGLLRGAARDGVERAELEAWLYSVLSEHFTDFGHQLIYLVKSQELLAHVDGEAYAADIHPALLYSAVVATREDTLPYMRPYAQYLHEVEVELPDVWQRQDPGAPFDSGALRAALLDGRSEEALDALWSALQAGVTAARVAGALVLAAAERLARYDPALEHDGTVAENFLWATHRLTFASAVRNAVERFAEPDALRFLFQAVAFVHSGRGMDLPVADRVPFGCDPNATPDDVLAAIAAKDPALAVAATRGCLEQGRVTELKTALEDFCLQDPLVRPIAVAHAIKTTFCAFEEWSALEGEADRALPLLATVRTWALPLVERRVHAGVATSVRWVVGGEVPRKLTQ